jgi:hypothetical protein
MVNFSFKNFMNEVTAAQVQQMANILQSAAKSPQKAMQTAQNLVAATKNQNYQDAMNKAKTVDEFNKMISVDVKNIAQGMTNVIKQLTPEQAQLLLQGEKGLEQVAQQLKPPFKFEMLKYGKYYSQPMAQKMLKEKGGANPNQQGTAQQGQSSLPPNAVPVRPKAAAAQQAQPNAAQPVNAS